jgi:molybdenum cofactor cytidylyltransferase
MDAWKMTLPWGRSTIVEHCVQVAASVCRRIVVVAGYRAEEIRERFRGWPRVEVVQNHRYEEGMFSSIKRGAGLLGEAPFFLALADMPAVPPSVYADLLRWQQRLKPALGSGGEAFAVIPRYRGKKGHPLLLTPGTREIILAAGVSATLRDVLAALPALVVPVEERGILSDIDTPSDYSAMKPSPPADAR